MSIFDWLKPVDKAIGVIDQFVEDKDEKNRLTAELESLKQQVYITELNTKTVPWVDAVHKMGRQILSILNLIVPAVLIHYHPDVDPMTLVAICGPSGIYNYVKGKGK